MTETLAVSEPSTRPVGGLPPGMQGPQGMQADRARGMARPVGGWFGGGLQGEIALREAARMERERRMRGGF